MVGSQAAKERRIFIPAHNLPRNSSCETACACRIYKSLLNNKKTGKDFKDFGVVGLWGGVS